MRCSFNLRFNNHHRFFLRLNFAFSYSFRLVVDSLHLLCRRGIIKNNRFEVCKRTVYGIAQTGIGRECDLRMSCKQDALAAVDINTLTCINIYELKRAKTFHLDKFLLHQRLLDNVEERLHEFLCEAYGDGGSLGNAIGQLG